MLWFGGTIVGLALVAGLLLQPLQELAFWIGDRYDAWFQAQQFTHPLPLLGFAFLGGLASSISPCILSLLPVNLSYIGIHDIQSRWDAFLKAGLFVLGVATMLTLLGLVAALGGAVLVSFQGYVQMAIGWVIVAMALTVWGAIHLPLPTAPTALERFGPYGVGLMFALVSSPCTSPIMLSVLATATATGSPVWSSLTMLVYTLGYTAIMFFASVFTGLVKQTRGLLPYADVIKLGSGAVLAIVGLFYITNGGFWILKSWQ